MILTVTSLARNKVSASLGILQRGNCDRVKRTDLYLHLLINVLSTSLLGASNYCMQYLSSPTRNEIDQAHQSNQWLDVGVPSIRNLWRISSIRRSLWLVLAISSAPLHLLYNSAIFSTLSYQEYTVFAVTQPFFSGGSWNMNVAYNDSDYAPAGNFFAATPDINYTSDKPDHVQHIVPGTDPNDVKGPDYPEAYEERLKFLQAGHTDSVVRLENKDCIAEYSPAVVSNYGDLLVVTNASFPDLGTLIGWSAEMDAGYLNSVGSDSWICPTGWQGCRTKNFAEDWIWEGNVSISYCLARHVEPHCETQFSIVILVIVVMCNVLKVGCIAITVFRSDLQPLVTLGDAIASFLDIPDATTVGMCLAEDTTFKKRKAKNQNQNQYQYHGTTRESEFLEQQPQEYKGRRRFWFAAPGWKRWLLIYITCFIALGAILFLYLTMTQNSTGFGTLETNNIVTLTNKLASANVESMVLLANSPQFLISLLYFGYNSLFTNMLLGQEWASYAHERKSLRVTTPRGSQRSTYRLQLPYKYGIPLLVAAALLHWLISQSLFLARLQAYRWDGTRRPEDDITSCAYSARPILVSLCLGFGLLLVGLAMGLRKYSKGVPLAGSCSLAISAACHAPPGDGKVSLKKIKWGVVNVNGNGNGNGNVVSSSRRRNVDGKREERSRKSKGLGDGGVLEFGERRVEEEDEDEDEDEDEGGAEGTNGAGYGVGHCCFTSWDVEKPVEGALYS